MTENPAACKNMTRNEEDPAEDTVSVGEPCANQAGTECIWDGIAVAPGIAIGPAYVFSRDVLEAEPRTLAAEDLAAEVDRFERAVARAERDLNKIISITREKLGEESASIFEAQLLMLRDDALYQAVVDHIRLDRFQADYAVKVVMTKHRRSMEASSSEYFRDRAHDLVDVQDRIIRHLRRGKLLSAIDADSIVVAENLTAADIILFSRRGILGCVLDFGGPTSHVSIMARALGVPAVVSLHGLTGQVRNGDLMILDGIRGRVILSPSLDTQATYRSREKRYRQLLLEDRQIVPLPAETLDGHRYYLQANLEFKEELPLLDTFGAEGIGLFRTEMLFLMQGRLSISEEVQYETYKEVVTAVRPHGTTFRMLDLGGDKMLPVAHREHNPYLGWRGIRVLLDKPDVLWPQLRAILRASEAGPVRLLLPMVTELSEVRRFKDILASVKAELTAEGLPFDPDIPLGIMVEVPAVALIADRFAAEVDFFSIGTNDLTQYVLAVDRGNDLVAGIYHELHPAVLRMIKMTVEAARRRGMSVSVCGELAARPQAVPILVGLGVDTFSASPVYLPGIKRVLRVMKRSEGEALVEQALAAHTSEDVEAMLSRWMDEHACGLQYTLEHEAEGTPGK